MLPRRRLLFAGADSLIYRIPLVDSLSPIVGPPPQAFTRSTVGTIVGYNATDSNLLLSIGANEPRFQGARYTGTGWSRTLSNGSAIPDSQLLGGLVEGQDQNLILRSEEIDNAVWAKHASVTVTANQTAAPDGNISADASSYTPTGFPYVYQADGTGADAIYTATAFVKKSTNKYAHLILIINPDRYAVTYDLDTGLFAAEYNTGTPLLDKSKNITQLPNGWYAISLSGRRTGGGLLYLVVEHSVETPTVNSTLDINNATSPSQMFIAGASMIQRRFATSHIYTAATTVPRTADSGFTYPNYIPANNFTIAVTVTFPQPNMDGGLYLFGSELDANNGVYLLSSGTQIVFRKRLAGVNYDATFNLSPAPLTRYKIVAEHKNSGMSVYVNGVKGTDNSNGNDAKWGQTFTIGQKGDGTGHSFCYHRDFMSWKSALGASRIAAL